MTAVAQMIQVGEPIPDPHPTIWHGVDTGIWVGHRDGEFAGMIEQRRGGGYVVTTRLGKSVGVFSTMEEAQHALR